MLFSKNRNLILLLFFGSWLQITLGQSLSQEDEATIGTLYQQGDQTEIYHFLEKKADRWLLQDSAANWASCLVYKMLYAEDFGELDTMEITIRRLDDFLRRYPAKFKPQDYHDLWFHTQKNSAFHDLYIGAYRSGQLKLEDLIRYLLDQTEPNIEYLSNAHLALGDALEDQGEYLAALGHVQKSLMYEQEGKRRAWRIGLIHKHFGDIYHKMGQFDRAIVAYKKALRLYEPPTSTRGRNRLITTHNAIASLYLKKGDSNNANIQLQLSVKYHSPNDPYWIETLRLQVMSYFAQGNWEQAEKSLQTAFAAQTTAGKNYNQARLLLARAILSEEQGYPDRALNDYDAALDQLTPSGGSSIGKCERIAPQRFLAGQEALPILYRKAALLYRLGTEPNLQCALATIQAAVDLVNSLRTDGISTTDEQTLVAEHFHIFEKAIEINNALSNLYPNDSEYLNYAFEVAEMSKSLLMANAFLNTAVENTRVPEEIETRERNLRAAMSVLADTITQVETGQAKYAGQGSPELQAFYSRLLELQTDWQALVDTIKAEHPEYYGLKFRTHVNSAHTVANGLTSEQLLVEYFVGEDSTWVFTLQRGQAPVLTSVPIGRSALEKQVQDFNRALTVPYSERDTTITETLRRQYPKDKAGRIYAREGYALYQLLLEKALAGRTTIPERLVIVPDGILNTLPFDALLMKAVPEQAISYYGNADYQYLLRSSFVSYCYSATFLAYMQRERASSSAENRVLAFDIPQFKGEITKIFTSWLGSSNWVEPLAEQSHQERLEAIGHLFRIIHFSVHGLVNQQNPSQSYLTLRPYGQDSILSVSELYKLYLPADLVVTSACSAGVGEIHRGSGSLSVARGFAYAGTRSLVTSLWALQSGKTAPILADFYQRIADGETKDQSLTLAKRDFLASNGDQYNHPYYWAALVAVGDMQAIDDGPYFVRKWYWLVAILLILLLVRRVSAKNRNPQAAIG